MRLVVVCHLNRCSVRHRLVRVDAFAELLVRTVTRKIR